MRLKKFEAGLCRRQAQIDSHQHLLLITLHLFTRRKLVATYEVNISQKKHKTSFLNSYLIFSIRQFD